MHRSSPFRSTLNTSYITGLGMCKVCTEAVHSVALWNAPCVRKKQKNRKYLWPVGVGRRARRGIRKEQPRVLFSLLIYRQQLPANHSRSVPPNILNSRPRCCFFSKSYHQWNILALVKGGKGYKIILTPRRQYIYIYLVYILKAIYTALGGYISGQFIRNRTSSPRA